MFRTNNRYCDSVPSPLTTAPREGQGPSIYYFRNLSVASLVVPIPMARGEIRGDRGPLVWDNRSYKGCPYGAGFGQVFNDQNKLPALFNTMVIISVMISVIQIGLSDLKIIQI